MHVRIHTHNTYTLLNCSLFILYSLVAMSCDKSRSELVTLSLLLSLLLLCQVKTQTQILISHWRRRGVCPSRHRRARTMCACVDASSDASNGLVIVNVYSQSPLTTVEKVLISLLQNSYIFIDSEARGVQNISFILSFMMPNC